MSAAELRDALALLPGRDRVKATSLMKNGYASRTSHKTPSAAPGPEATHLARDNPVYPYSSLAQSVPGVAVTTLRNQNGPVAQGARHVRQPDRQTKEG
jgi:hypothetical protein